MKSLFITFVILIGVTIGSVVSAKVPIDQVPMYGGMDRSQYDVLNKADERLIEDVTQQFGSREKASMAFVEAAFSYYQRGDNQKAMARFNQAWLINPNNIEVYWGFSSILHDAGKYCEGFKILELGLAKGSLQAGYKPDLAVLYAGCAMHGEQVTGDEKKQYLKKSTDIFIEAESDEAVPKPYLYFQWARVLNAQEQYEQAWAIVKKYRSVTDTPFDERLLKKITNNMAEPK